MLEQKKRFVVRDLTKRFEKVLESTTELCDQTQVAEIVSIDTFIHLKKLWDILVNLRKHVVGENKDDQGESISMVETLADELSQTDGSLIYQKDKVTNQAKTLKKAAEEAKKVVEEQTKLIIAQVDKTRATMQTIVEAVDEREQIIENEMNQNSKKLKELMSEVQEARRIIMLHQPSRVKDMESELQALRIKLEEKSKFCATKLVYAPEPFDVGCFLQAEITTNKERVDLRTTSPIKLAVELENYVEDLVQEPKTKFNVCGVSHGGGATAQSIIWQTKHNLSFTLGFESTRERNAAIMLARRFAFDSNIVAGSNDGSSSCVAA